MAWGRFLQCLGALAAAAGLAACDSHDTPAPPAKALTVPKGENTFDDLIRKSEAKAAPSPGRLDALPGRLDFPAVTAGESTSRQITLSNDGQAPVSLQQVRVSGSPALFRLSGDCVPPHPIEGQGNCGLLVTFQPQQPGPAQGDLVISADTGLLIIPLTGLAQAAAPMAAAPRPPNSPASASLIFARSRQDAGLTVEGDGSGGETERRARDPDYGAAGLPGLVSGFPVDRSRVITADRYIPAVLENSINSQLAGRAVAVVESNVYGADGRLVLIPAGARVVGRTQSLAKAGQARLEINWTRILRPDGTNINIDFAGADVMGRTGLPGELDSRFYEKYGASLLTSAIAAAGIWALNGTSTAIANPLGGTTQTLSGSAQAANRLGNDLDQLGQRMVEDTIDVRPVLTVAEGTRLAIIPSEDIWLRDPDRLQAVTPPKGIAAAGRLSAETLVQLLPNLIDLVVQSPGFQKAAPQTAQQILQSALLQQLRAGNDATPGTKP